MSEERENLALNLAAMLRTGLNVHEMADRMIAVGYRIDHYPNGKSKPELIATIEAKQAELDRARVLLYNLVNPPKEASMAPAFEAAAFLTETSTVKS